MTFRPFSPPCRISEEHEFKSFDCGEPTLNHWLQIRGISNDHSGASRTYVLCEGNTVVGFYCLATGGVDRDTAPNQLRRNMPDPIPVVVLGRLAVDCNYQNRGLGQDLLQDAVQRSLQVAEIAGATALIVHAKSEEARRFYMASGFVDWPLQPMTLYLMLRSAREL
jgi:GNAT superfamily N-acetyltransferase